MESQMLYNHVNFNTCFKSAQGSKIDLILSNQKHSLQCTGCVDTGVSDFHQLVYTILKSTFTKLPPKRIVYRCFQNFVPAKFLHDLSQDLYNNGGGFEGDYDHFEGIFVSALDKHAPLKSKFVRGNEKPHMNKALKKAIMKRSHLWNVYQKSKSSSDLSAYRVQRNFVSKLNKQS